MRTPRLVASVKEARALELSMADGFLLACIDGARGEGELAMVTGRSLDEVRASLSTLESLGLIKIDEVAVQRRAPPKVSPGPGRAQPRSGASGAALDDDMAAMGEDVDLEPRLRTELLSLHRALDQIDHYALLGIDRGTTKQDAKRAYYSQAAKFHPDRYFRKRLGSFKIRMEAIFSRLTLAHETLSNSEKRAEYDLYLDDQRKLRGFESVLADAANESRRAQENVEREVRAEEPTPFAPPVSERPPPPLAPASPAPAVPPPGAAPRPPTRSSPDIDPAIRREAFARRLLGGRSTTPIHTPLPTRLSEKPPPMNAAAAMDALRRRYEDRVAAARGVEARKYVTRAEEALKANRVAVAASAFQVAAGLAPSDPDLKRRAASAQAEADSLLAESYLRQAEYEEKNGQWREAARSWAGACRARPNDPRVHQRAAGAMLKVGGPLTEAIALAERAAELAPEDARTHATLGEVYLSAGRAPDAKRALERAAGLDPRDDSILQLLKKVPKAP
jgi:curved DNA-binding protein CbpA